MTQSLSLKSQLLTTEGPPGPNFGRRLLRMLCGSGVPSAFVSFECTGRPKSEQLKLAKMSLTGKTLLVVLSPLGCLIEASELATFATDNQNAAAVVVATARYLFSVGELEAFSSSPIHMLFLTHEPFYGLRDRMKLLD